MKLKYVRIRNFRSIKDLTINFEPRCRVLVGINESGKSNILRALSHLDPGRKTTADDLRELGRDESPDQQASIWFVFSLDTSERVEIYETIAGKVFADEKAVLVNQANRQLTLKKLCDESAEALYAVDLVSKTKNGSYWSFGEKIKVPGNWKKPIKASQARVTDSSGVSHLVTRFAAIDGGSATDVDENQLVPLTNIDVERLIGGAISAFVVENLPPVVFWEYSEENLLPATVDTAQFTTDPDICLPLKHMFELAGFLDAAKAIQEASARSNGLRNLLERVADLTTRHMRSVWKDLKNVKVQLSQQGGSIEAVVRDAVNTFNFQRRSDGFKRFFTFLLMISVKAKTKTLRDTLYLHDEPEISLHPSGAQFLRDELISISASNDVVYSTHSIFMIDRKNIGHHLIVKRVDEVTTLEGVDQSNFMEEEVLYNALNWSVFESLKATNIVFEGWRDHRLFTIASSRVPASHKPVAKAVPDWGSCYAKGVTDVRRVAAMLQLANRECFIVSDGDKTAKEHQREYDGFGEWFRYDELGAPAILTAEDFVTLTHFEGVAKRFLATENAALPSFENVVPAIGGGRLDVLKNWLARHQVGEIKAVVERFKTTLFDTLKPSHIEVSYFDMLEGLRTRIRDSAQNSSERVDL